VAVSSARGSSALALAARYVGIPYVYGGTTPSGFDCSGFTQYVFNLLGFSLPRTVDEQLSATTRISRSQAVAGDLVFILSGGVTTHVGIYAGGNLMYDSPRTGESISLRSIWTSNVLFGRVTG
jgi:cell wall-associated NlpC family hydrolase